MFGILVFFRKTHSCLFSHINLVLFYWNEKSVACVVGFRNGLSEMKTVFFKIIRERCTLDFVN